MKAFMPVLIATIAWIGVTPATPLPEDARPFEFPAVPGTTWVYRSTSPRGKVTAVVSDVATDKDRSVTVTINSTESDGHDGLWEKLSIQGHRLLLHQHGPFKHTPPTPWLLHPFNTTAKWAIDTTLVTPGSEFHANGVMTQYPVERVNVPAGRFDAVRVCVRGTLLGPWSQTRWYASGIGEVKRDDGGGSTLELVSFTRGRANRYPTAPPPREVGTARPR